MFDFRSTKTIELTTCTPIDKDKGVYSFTESVTGKYYVLKVFEVKNFNDYQIVEFRKLALLSAEPEIATVYGLVSVQDGENTFIGYIMEYIDGDTLENVLKPDVFISLNYYNSVLEQLAKGMEKAHYFGVIHGDLKWHNVMIDAFGNVKIIDFFWADNGATAADDIENYKEIAFILYNKLSTSNQKHADVIHQFIQSITIFKDADSYIASLQEISFELGFLSPKGKLLLSYLIHNEESELNRATKSM
ncbi:protein kinase [Mucilaginibacter sp. L196]|uniref:protein kinase domain-containing protein n=1 Tax=Mucilaginibacter sp. L196 TaxID=1641870 RepID=UPI00131ECA40|nr:protein kinase [Mucilaginibacter sp. L196]